MSDQNVKPAPQPAAVDGDWHRVHPLSPLIRGWLVMAVVLYIFVQTAGDDLVEALITGGEFEMAGRLWTALMISGGVFVLALVGYLLSWRFTQYRLTQEHVQLHSGVVFRQQRQVRLDRVQAVDLRQPLLARLFGLAELKFEAADGAGDAAMALQFIRRQEAEQLRQEILLRASGLQAGMSPEGAADPSARPAEPVPGTEAGHQAGVDDGADLPLDAAGGAVGVGRPSSPEEVMLKVPLGRLIGSILLSTVVTSLVWVLVFLVLWLIVIGGILQEWQTALSSLWILLIPLAVSALTGIWSQVNQGYGFTLARSEDGLRLRYGLTETNQQTVPPGRVQAIKVHQPWLWRPFGWHRVMVNVAGYGNLFQSDAGQGKSMVLPVGPWEDVLRVLTVVAPDPGVEPGQDAADLMREGIAGSGTEGGFVHSPRSARWLDPWTWRRTAVRTTQSLVLLRSGRLARRLVIMPYERVQSLDLQQGPLERRLGLANLSLHSTVGPVTPALKHASVHTARTLFAEVSAVAARSRRMADRDQWMRPEELARFERRTREAQDELMEAGL